MDLVTCTIIKVCEGPREQNGLNKGKQGHSLFPIRWLTRMFSYCRHSLTLFLRRRPEQQRCELLWHAEDWTLSASSRWHDGHIYSPKGMKAMQWTSWSKAFLMISSYCISHALFAANKAHTCTFNVQYLKLSYRESLHIPGRNVLYLI